MVEATKADVARSVAPTSVAAVAGSDGALFAAASCAGGLFLLAGYAAHSRRRAAHAMEHKPLAMDEAVSAMEDSATAEQPADDADACEERAKLTAAV